MSSGVNKISNIEFFSASASAANVLVECLFSSVYQYAEHRYW